MLKAFEVAESLPSKDFTLTDSVESVLAGAVNVLLYAVTDCLESVVSSLLNKTLLSED